MPPVKSRLLKLNTLVPFTRSVLHRHSCSFLCMNLTPLVGVCGGHCFSSSLSVEANSRNSRNSRNCNLHVAVACLSEQQQESGTSHSQEEEEPQHTNKTPSPPPPQATVVRARKKGIRGETSEERKARKDALKLEKLRKREKRTNGEAKQLKPCDICGHDSDLLIRCQIDASGDWKFVCGKRCWKSVSGGVTDGDADHPHYRYGGLWKAHGA